MGFEQIEGMDDFHFVDFSGGWFPNKNRREIPGGFYTSKGKNTQNLVNGFSDVQHSIWYEATLRKWFGYTVVPSAQVNSGANGAGIGNADWRGENTQFGIFGTKFYEFDSSGVATDRTAAITLDNTQPYVFKTHIQGATRNIIGGNGYGAMISWTGTGNNITSLAGSPHNFQSFDYYGDRWWGVRRDSNWNFIYGSDLTNPAITWNDAGIIFPFKDSIYGVVSVGTWLAVVGRSSINSLEGFGSTTFKKEERILEVGSTAHRTLAKGQIYDQEMGQWINGFYMVSWSGPVFVTESRSLKQIGQSMEETWNATTGLSKSNLYKSCGVWWENKKFYVFAVPWDDDTDPTRMFVYDARRGSIWPMPDIINDGTTGWYVRSLAVMKDSNEDEWLYMQDSNGWYYKFNPDQKNFYPNNTKTAIETHAQSKVFDLNGVWDLREPQLYAKAVGDWDIEVYFKFDSESGDGSFDSVNMANEGNQLSVDFILGASTLGGTEYIFESVEVSGFGSFIQFKFKNYNADESFNIEELILWMKFLRYGSLR